MTTDDTDRFVELWYADEYVPDVVQVKAYPRQNGYWVPSKGCSCDKGTSLFDTRPEAVARVRGLIANQIAKLQMLQAKAEKL